ncbi:uncharacterized protein LOC106073481 [Biomphalaria glabrata]|uniref:Uncharacterized protein LOC106073481 n=1 Tax=Biomphalaria glabrata TaxID=6526 RepID=A0A9W2Z8X5_BIOGL|nr:uncharacterized protein LOC106073481 [Biomphalaria glabrata]KAI8736785.1 hypothetical protein BgiMline_025939 [Biomphalaria glabrata]
MSSQKAPINKSTIYDTFLSKKKYEDPLKKQPVSFKGNIVEGMKKNPVAEENNDMKYKEPYKGSIYGMMKVYPTIKRNLQEKEEKKPKQPVFRQDSTMITGPVVTSRTTAPTAQVQNSQWTGLAPGSSVGSVSRTLALFG